MININSTLPVNLALLLSVNIPLLNSLPRLELLRNALEFKLTSTKIFFGGMHSRLALCNNNLPHGHALVQERCSGRIKLIGSPICVLDSDLGCKTCIKRRCCRDSVKV
ncbi:unnamed protein product [Prunus brigantina]